MSPKNKREAIVWLSRLIANLADNDLSNAKDYMRYASDAIDNLLKEIEK